MWSLLNGDLLFSQVEMAPLGNTDSTEFLQGRYYLYILNACTCLQNDSRAHHWRLLQSKALLWILAKIRVWLGYRQQQEGRGLAGEKGKDSQNESTCRRSYLLSWWNLPAFGRPEYTTQRFVEKSRVGQDKTKQTKHQEQYKCIKRWDFLWCFSMRNSP